MRGIDALSEAGIPIFAVKGKGGDPGIYDYFLSLGKGVKIMEPAFAREYLVQLIEEIKKIMKI